MKTNARKEAGIINPETKFYMELDIYLPELKLALEFQVLQLARKLILILCEGKASLHQRQQIHSKLIGGN